MCNMQRISREGLLSTAVDLVMPTPGRFITLYIEYIFVPSPVGGLHSVRFTVPYVLCAVGAPC